MEDLKTVKKTVIGWILGFFLTSCVGLTTFYFQTTYVTAQNKADIQQIRIDQKKIISVPVLNQSKIQNIEKDIDRIEKAQREIRKENKESNKEMRKEIQKMIELLYQIRNQNRQN